jgi:hypothetical protein
MGTRGKIANAIRGGRTTRFRCNALRKATERLPAKPGYCKLN